MLQAFTNERLGIARFDDAVQNAFIAARGSIMARAVLTGIAIFLVSASVVVVLWIGAHEVLALQITPVACLMRCCLLSAAGTSVPSHVIVLC